MILPGTVHPALRAGYMEYSWVFREALVKRNVMQAF
jgi:hypothetical protein